MAMGTTSKSNTWLIGGGLAALAAIIALLFTDSGVLAGVMGVIAVTVIATGFTVRGKAGGGNGKI
jgi:uncharacterized membrane protein YgaE (UPF0421/DUF939 family)